MYFSSPMQQKTNELEYEFQTRCKCNVSIRRTKLHPAPGFILYNTQFIIFICIVFNESIDFCQPKRCPICMTYNTITFIYHTLAQFHKCLLCECCGCFFVKVRTYDHRLTNKYRFGIGNVYN